jgi:hypothetical protein
MPKVNGYEIESGAYLSGANLSGAKLRRAMLSRADLTSANLTGADLTGADLSGSLWDSSTIWPDGFIPPKREGETSHTEPTETDLLKQQLDELKKMTAAQQNQFTQRQKQRSMFALGIMGIIVGTKLSGYW